MIGLQYSPSHQGPRDLVPGAIRFPLHQWKREAQYWVDTSLAALQQKFVRFAMGPLNSERLNLGPEESFLH